MKARGLIRFSEEHALLIFTQIAIGLSDIHKQSIVHRDIKHKNILLSDRTKTPKVKIADFGLACYLDNEECFIQDAGTVGYMAPEIIME